MENILLSDDSILKHFRENRNIIPNVQREAIQRISLNNLFKLADLFTSMSTANFAAFSRRDPNFCVHYIRAHSDVSRELREFSLLISKNNIGELVDLLRPLTDEEILIVAHASGADLIDYINEIQNRDIRLHVFLTLSSEFRKAALQHVINPTIDECNAVIYEVSDEELLNFISAMNMPLKTDAILAFINRIESIHQQNTLNYILNHCDGTINQEIRDHMLTYLNTPYVFYKYIPNPSDSELERLIEKQSDYLLDFIPQELTNENLRIAALTFARSEDLERLFTILGDLSVFETQCALFRARPNVLPLLRASPHRDLPAVRAYAIIWSGPDTKELERELGDLSVDEKIMLLLKELPEDY